MSNESINPAQTHEGYLRTFRDPSVTNEQLHHLLDAVNGFLDVITPVEGEYVPEGGWAPRTTPMAFLIGRAVEQVLAERETASRELAHRQEILDRVLAALDSLRACALAMPELVKAELIVGSKALAEGFLCFEDGSVRTTAKQEKRAPLGLLEQRRADLEELLTIAVTERINLTEWTRDTVRERLGVAPDEVGIPWVLVEAATYGIQVKEPLELAVRALPGCPLESLLTQLITDADLARTLADADR